MSNSPAFLYYSSAMVLLCINVLALWGYSGAARAKTKTTMNPEDVVHVARGAAIVPHDPPEVARVLRAHRNAVDNIWPFAILGLLFVMWGGGAKATAIFCGVFVFARLGHTLAYLGEKQPWRTIFFTIASLDTLVLTAFLIKRLVEAV